MTPIIILHGCRTLQLTKGFNALIDEDDFGVVGHLKWCASTSRTSTIVYVTRSINMGKIDGKQKNRTESIHRVLMNHPEGLVVDHKNTDARDNRRDNLRVCTQTENMRNRRTKAERSGFKGVSPDRYDRWQCTITHEGKRIHLGMFSTAIEAARAYDAAAIRLHGQFARTNAELFGI